MAKKLSNDEWTLHDNLGYGKLVDQTILLLEEAKPPFALGIYGSWGTGKTSIMKQIYYRIGGMKHTFVLPFIDNKYEEGISTENLEIITKWKPKTSSYKKKFETVWYNPWQYQFDSNPVVGILREIREKFSFLAATGHEGGKLADTTIRTGLDVLTSVIKAFTTVHIDPAKIEKHIDKIEAEHFDIKSSSERFRIIFEQAIGKLLKKNQKLVVFIDDLDRCTDDQIIKLLEGIKLYLSTSNCIFVFGMDQKNVVNALKSKNIHRDYLDKLFQSIIRIPLSEKYITFIEEIIGQYFVELNNEANNGLKKEFTELLADILEKNPRKIKNFLNSLRIYWEMIKSEADIEIKKLALFHYLRIFYEDIFTILERNPSSLKNLINVCKNEPPSTKIEHYFKKFLKNPITELVLEVSSESETALDETPDEDELQFIESISTRFEALDKFKEHFIANCEDLTDEQQIKKYIGVISNE